MNTLHLKPLTDIWKRFFLFPLLFAVLLLGCKKKDDEPKMPAQTQTGVNILWCKVNGETHEYKHKSTYLNDNGVSFFLSHFPDDRQGIQILASDRIYNDDLNLVVNVISEINHENIPKLNKSFPIINFEPWTHSYYFIGNGNHQYMVDSTISSIIFTRFDDEVAAGTFEYHGVNDNNDTVHITEGFFDISRK